MHRHTAITAQEQPTFQGVQISHPRHSARACVPGCALLFNCHCAGRRGLLWPQGRNSVWTRIAGTWARSHVIVGMRACTVKSKFGVVIGMNPSVRLHPFRTLSPRGTLWSYYTGRICAFGGREALKSWPLSAWKQKQKEWRATSLCGN